MSSRVKANAVKASKARKARTPKIRPEVGSTAQETVEESLRDVASALEVRVSTESGLSVETTTERTVTGTVATVAVVTPRSPTLPVAARAVLEILRDLGPIVAPDESYTVLGRNNATDSLLVPPVAVLADLVSKPALVVEGAKRGFDLGTVGNAVYRLNRLKGYGGFTDYATVRGKIGSVEYFAITEYGAGLIAK